MDLSFIKNSIDNTRRIKWSDFLKEVASKCDELILQQVQQTNKKYAGGKATITAQKYETDFSKVIIVEVVCDFYFKNGDDSWSAIHKTITRDTRYLAVGDAYNKEIIADAETCEAVRSVLKEPLVMNIVEPKELNYRHG